MPSNENWGAEPVVVVARDEVLAPRVMDQLAALLPNRKLQPKGDLAEAGKLGDGQIILVVTDPTEAVARRLSVLGSIEQALADWKSELEPLVATARRLRRRLWLFDARSLAVADPTTAAHFSGQASLVSGADVPPLPMAVCLLIAEVAVTRDPEAARISAEIAALRRGASCPLVSLEVCADAVRDYVTAKDQTTLLSATVAEAHVSYRALTSEKEDLTKQAKSLEQECNALKQTVARLTQDLEKVSATANEQRAAADRVSADLRKSLEQAKVSSTDDEYQKLKDELAAQKGETAKALEMVSRLQAEAAVLRENIALQLAQARPVAQSAHWAAAGQSLATAAGGGEDANHALTKQLQATVADLKLQTGKAQALQRQLEAASQRSERREAVLAAVLLEDQLALSDMRSKQQSERVEQLTQELQRVYASKSWRITQPLRALRERPKR